jgi:Ca2+/Na+ antiporter
MIAALEGPMTALSPGDPWTVIGAIAFTAAVVSLAAAVVYLIATARQDREERTRPERRHWVSIEESNAETRRQDSKVQLALAVVAILVVVVVSTLGA